MRFTPLFALVLLPLGAVATPAFADKRVALVIGNSDYSAAPRLRNPSGDAEAMGVLFKSAGFDSVETRQNLNRRDMRRAIRDFAELARDADVVAVFYAGHGIETGGNSYLVPTDAKLVRDVDAEDQAVSLAEILRVIKPAKQLGLVLFDASRDNPFARAMQRIPAGRALGRGLAKIDPTDPNTLIAYATRAGSEAVDGDGPHSPFTAALLKNLMTPGLDIRRAFMLVRDEVMQATGNKQEPFVYGSLGASDVTLASPAERDRNR
jgi:uncharacterized caspase-like protein